METTLPSQGSTESQPVYSTSLTYDLNKDVRFFGRTYEEDGIHYFNWSASGFSVRFKGSGVMAEIYSNDVTIAHKAYIKVYVDGVEMDDVMLKTTKQSVILAMDLDPEKEHTVCVLKRTSADNSQAGVGEIRLKDGCILPPEEDKELLFEFLGDSLTVGYVAAHGGNRANAWSTTTEDVTGTYCKQIADAFHADYNVIAISGKGVALNNDGTSKGTLPEIYKQLDFFNKPNVVHDFKRQADVIVINLGTNDEAPSNKNLTPEAFKAALRQFLKDIRERNPKAYIIYAYGLTRDGLLDEMEETINQLRSEGDRRVCLVKLKMCESWEKNLNHTERDAYVSRGESIIEKIEEITGWQAVN